ncbi:MAG: class I SAM-dependent methyltransferase, partial [Caulobacteraceae bacterium]
LVRSAGSRAKARKLEPGAKLHFGCGPNLKPGWVNVDGKPGADLLLDLARPLPMPSDVAAAAYSEHFLEHLDYPEPAGRFVRECFRVLRPGGLFSVGVPDTEWALRSYAGGHDYLRACEEHRWHPAWCRTELEHINYHFRQDGEHRFAYDLDTLTRLLSEAGFVEIRQRDFDPGLDHPYRAVGTLYLDARKPGG